MSQSKTPLPLDQVAALEVLVERTTALYERQDAIDSQADPDGHDLACEEMGEAAAELDVLARSVLLPIVQMLLDGIEHGDVEAVTRAAGALMPLPTCVRRLLVESWRPDTDPENNRVFRVVSFELYAFLLIDRIEEIDREADAASARSV